MGFARWVTFAWMFSLYAHAEPCSNLDNNSCWQTENLSSLSATVGCLYMGSHLYTAQVSAKESLSRQGCWGCDDGMGYPKADVRIDCTVTLADGKRGQISFTTLDWGDRVKFTVTDNRVEVLSRSYWSDRKRTVSEPIR